MNITLWEKFKNDLAPGKHGVKQILLFLQRNVSAKIMKYIYVTMLFHESIPLHLKILAKLNKKQQINIQEQICL